jgi:hypothetical protein
MQIVVVPDEGHVPVLAGDIVTKVAQFATACDNTRAIL